MNNPLSTDRHSPGPWRAARTPINPWWKVYIEGHEIAEVEGGDVVVYNDPDHPEAVEANAKLIAAAPDLLDVVRDMAQYGGGMEYDDWRALVQRAEAALTKAGVSDER